MMKVKLLLLLAALLILLFTSGCSEEPAGSVGPEEPVEPDQVENNLPPEIEAWLEDSLMLFLGQARSYEGKLYLLATYGEQMTGGFIVEIVTIEEEADRLVVTVNFSDPGGDEMVTQALTYPFDLVVIDDPGLPVEFMATGSQDYLPTLYGLEYLPSGSHGSQWIRIFKPLPGDPVDDRFKVEGIGNVFEGNIQYRLLDADHKRLDEGFTTAAMGDWGFFSFEMETGGLISGSALVLELFTGSPKDGSEENLVSIDLTVK
jgi:hypothetical protein